jgi:phage terminase small subunit
VPYDRFRYRARDFAELMKWDMGRRRKLAALDRLDGNPSRRLIDDSGIEALGEPFTPEHLSDDARGCIDIIRQSMPHGVYSALDSFLLSAFATAWALHKRAVCEMAKPDFDHIQKTKRGAPTANAWIRIANDQARVLASLGDRLGLDPKSRAALKLPDAPKLSKFEGLLGRDSLTLRN